MSSATFETTRSCSPSWRRGHLPTRRRRPPRPRRFCEGPPTSAVTSSGASLTPWRRETSCWSVQTPGHPAHHQVEPRDLHQDDPEPVVGGRLQRRRHPALLGGDRPCTGRRRGPDVGEHGHRCDQRTTAAPAEPQPLTGRRSIALPTSSIARFETLFPLPMTVVRFATSRLSAGEGCSLGPSLNLTRSLRGAEFSRNCNILTPR